MSALSEIVSTLRNEVKDLKRKEAFLEWLGKADTLEQAMAVKQHEIEDAEAQLKAKRDEAVRLAASAASAKNEQKAAEADTTKARKEAADEVDTRRREADTAIAASKKQAEQIVLDAQKRAQDHVTQIEASSAEAVRRRDELFAEVQQAEKQLAKVKAEVAAFVRSLPKVA